MMNTWIKFRVSHEKSSQRINHDIPSFRFESRPCDYSLMAALISKVTSVTVRTPSLFISALSALISS